MRLPIEILHNQRPEGTHSALKPRFSRLSVLLVAAAAFIVSVLVGVAAGRPNLSGDAWEYSWVAYSIAEHGSPVIDIHHREALARKFPEPHLLNKIFLVPDANGRYDAPHFWMYSLLASPFYLFCDAIGSSFLYAFLLLHAALIGLAAGVAYALYAKRGAATFAVFVVASPVLFYLSKPHTELFTFCWFALALLFLAKGRLPASAYCLAMAATQNTPFIPFVLLIIGMTVFYNAPAKRLATLAILGGSLVLAALNPAYYWIRHGVINGHIAVGQAGLSSISWRKALSLFIDPDIGLFANWPLGLIILAVAAFLHQRVRKAVRRNLPVAVFTAVFVLVMPFFQTMAANWNHGGTVHVSRYAIWYVPVFFIWLVLIATEPAPAKAGWLTRTGVLAFAFAALPAIAFNIGRFSPSASQDYLRRTEVSEIIYRYVPSLYDPVPEVFVERAAGREGELAWVGDWAASNEACNKIYIPALPAERANLPKPAGCEEPIDGARLLRLVKEEHLLTNGAGYVNLPAGALQNLTPTYIIGTSLRFSSPSAAVYLGHGWSIQESGGRWSDGDKAEIAFRPASLPIAAGVTTVMRITGAPYTSGTSSCGVTVLLNGAPIGMLNAQHQSGAETYELPLRLAAGETSRLGFRFQGVRDVRHTPDPRRLCFYLKSMEIVAQRALEMRGGVSVYREGEIVDFAQPASAVFLTKGWSAQEPHGRWSDGSAASIAFHLVPSNDAPADYVFLITGAPFLRNGRAPVIEVQVNGVHIGNLDAGHKPVGETYRFRVPGLTLGKCEVKFVMRGNLAPAGGDPRGLGFYIKTFQVLPAKDVAPEYNLGTLIDFSEPSSDRFLAAGWSVQEQYGRWSDGNLAEIRFQLKAPPQSVDRPGVLIIHGGKFKTGGQDLQMRLFLDGQLIGAFDNQHMTGDETYTFPLLHLTAGTCVLRLQLDNPKARNAGGDPRQLGFYIQNLKMASK